MLTDRSNGIRIKGLVLAVEAVKEVKGVSKGGNNYAFLTREMQIFTGNKAVACKDQRDLDKSFPEIRVGTIVEYKIKSVRMNGTVPNFELDTETV